MEEESNSVCAVQARGKINIGLRVLRRRMDGYHDLETVYYPIRWADTLTVRDAQSIVLTSTAPELVCDGSNLVVRAARALVAEIGAQGGAAMRLVKRLPMGAGLGGGSSDAAAALSLLLRLWNQRLDPDVLRRLALSLGSDVPYFLNPVPSYATGRGEVLTTLAGYVLPFSLVVVVPRVHISTAWAFSRVTPLPVRSADLRAIVMSNDLNVWRHALTNDFEVPVFAAYPQIRVRKEMLLVMGAKYASLTGTGAAVYGMFESQARAAAAADEARAAGCTVHLELAS